MLTERQKRELAYHHEHASSSYASRVLDRPLSYAALEGDRWWNGYWSMFGLIRAADLTGKRVMVVGCGFGEDAVRLARMGAVVDAFDLSPDSLAIAKQLAQREGVEIAFAECPAETLPYADGRFDAVVARDILHHVDMPAAIAELKRVSKPGARWIINEMYSHSGAERIRRSSFVEKLLYPMMVKFVYSGDKPYITEDELKLTEADVRMLKGAIDVHSERYFNFLVTRVIPDRWGFVNRLDRALLKVAAPIAHMLAGRVLLAGAVQK